MWKEVFLPPGTRLRIKIKDDYAYAEVIDDHVVFDGQRVSPAEFANSATGTTRNAWRDVWVKRPTDSAWSVADDLRRRGAPTPRERDDRNRLVEVLELTPDDLLSAASDRRTYRDDIKAALEKLGGKAPRQRVIEEVRKIREERGANIPPTFGETVQNAYECHCVDSDNFDGQPDHALFAWPNGKYDGTWALNRP
jgi:hypothetical protein